MESWPQICFILNHETEYNTKFSEFARRPCLLLLFGWWLVRHDFYSVFEHMSQTDILKEFIMKKGFTLIELMIVVAIIAILAMIAVPMYQSYIENARNASAMALLKQFALANEAHNAVPGGGYVTVMGAAANATPAEVGGLLPFGFRPDPNVIFHVIPSVAAGGYVIFAASNTVGAPVYMYNSQSGQGAIQDDFTGGAHGTVLTSYTFTPATASADAKIEPWGTAGKVKASTAAKPGEVETIGKGAKTTPST